MSAGGTRLQASDSLRAAPVGLGGLAGAEWILLRSVRSTWWTLAATLAITVLIGFGACAATKSAVGAEQAANSALGGFFIGTLLLVALATVFSAGEFTTGMMTSSALAIPSRGRLLAAKAIVIAAATFAGTVLIGVLCFLVGAAALGDTARAPGLFSGQAAMPLLWQAVTTTLLALLGLGIGTVVRSTAGGITLAIGLTFVLPFALAAIPVDLLHRLAPYLPTVTVGATGTPWATLAACAGWAAGSLILATVLGARRDI